MDDAPTVAPLDLSERSPPPTEVHSQAAPWWYEEGILPAVESLGAGAEHVCGLLEGGLVRCWGSDDHARLEVPDGAHRALDVGGEHACSLLEDGSIRCWGRDVAGSTRPPQGRFVQVAAGFGTSCARREDGSLTCWGWNGDGQASPPAGTYRDVTVGYRHACAIDDGGDARCWGWGADGQAQSQPGPFVKLALGQTHSCGLLEDGTLRCWGAEPKPEGVGATMSTDGAPVSPPSRDGWVGGILTVPPGRYLDLGAGGLNSCALHEKGSVICWGHDAAFQSRPPAGDYTHLAVGYFHACAIERQDGPVCWGWRGRIPPPRGAEAAMPITCPWEGLGLLYLTQDRRDEARETLERAAELVPWLEHDKYNGLARIYMDEGKLTRARSALDRSVTIDPNPKNDAWDLMRELGTLESATAP